VIDGFDADVDEIFHLACPASPRYYQKDPIGTIRTCVEGSLRMLELADRCGARILLSSTSETYGDPLVHPQVETYWGNVNPIGPRSPYDEGKRCAEALFFSFQQQRGTRIKVARVFNTYGPLMDPADGRVISNFISQALTGSPLTVFGSGRQTRSFCYIDDLVDGLLRLMASAADITGPVNLGNPDEFTVSQLAELIIRRVGNPGVVYESLPIDDPHRRRPDISLARAVLGWAPRVALDEGIDRTIEYYTTHLPGR
jgi:UDP-glucuronate decarboxylase